MTVLIVQKDGTYMFNLDGMIPKLCLLAQEMREDGSEKHLRSAGLKTLSSMVIHLNVNLILVLHIIFVSISRGLVIDNFDIVTYM